MAERDDTQPVEQSMTLADAFTLPLTAGKYEVRVEQTVRHAQIGETEGTFKKTSTFWVSAPRFTLPSSDIYAMYPPADAQGDFSEALPHVVLKRRTLPWERRLEPPERTPKPDDAPAPWLALLLLNEDELGVHAPRPIKLESRVLREVWRKELPPQPWERDDDACTTLDIPFQLFQAIAPAWEDLPYLAHARHVGRTAHMEADGIEDEGWFSVVVGNRRPTPGKENRVYLVSLEGLENWLPDEHGEPAGPGHPETIRLVVLASWRFVDEEQGREFRTLVTGLKCAPLRLQAGAAVVPANGSQSQADQEIDAALGFGYAPLEHQTRQGYHTVSWYRGPLTPHFLPTDPRNAVYPCADAALRYDRSRGLLDVSYAAAWQLGRLLGLENAPFAAAVCRMKLRAVQKVAEATRRKTLTARFGADEAGTWDEIAAAFLEDNPLSQGEVEDRRGNLPPAADQSHTYEALRAGLDGHGEVELPLEVRQFLGRLFLLHGVPLGYLVPHPDMLPPESLRVFYLDTTWIGALLDGALGIGRVSASALALDKAMTGSFLADIVRSEAAVASVPAAQLSAVGADIGDPNIKEVVGHLTGFLLRSQLVSGWRGTEIQAYDDTKALRALRLQRIAQDTLLGIYDGQIKRVVITQSPQGVHFGAIDAAPYRGDSRVLQVSELARARGLADKRAEFAGAMLARRIEHTIEVKIETEPVGTRAGQ